MLPGSGNAGTTRQAGPATNGPVPDRSLRDRGRAAPSIGRA